jgi:hypothetical protein
MATEIPGNHPPIESIDWTKWEPAGEGDGMSLDQFTCLDTNPS